MKSISFIAAGTFSCTVLLLALAFVVPDLRAVTSAGESISWRHGIQFGGLSGRSAIAVSADRVYVGGSLERVDGEYRPNFAVLSAPVAALSKLPGMQTPQLLSDGGVRLRLSGKLSSNWVIQGSVDLKTWLPLFTNTAPAQFFEYTDTQILKYPARFYRAMER
jgi:hypothetical protein